MHFRVLTIFPQMISAYAGESILKRGLEARAFTLEAVNLRDFSTLKHQKVDDTPYGGGAGMVMMVEPFYRALEAHDALTKKRTLMGKFKKKLSLKPKKLTILMSPSGRQFDQRLAEEWAGLEELTILCGRYEGVDARVSERLVDEEVSIGPYVLAGGELGALAVVEAVARLLPGVLGNPDSLKEETHGRDNGLFEGEYPQYTKPVDFMGSLVPKVLLSGNHSEIDKWRKSQQKKP